MTISQPLLYTHIIAALIGLFSGYMAMFLKKGSSWHAAAGSVFTVSMLIMSTSAVYIAAFQHVIHMNIVASLLTFYLVCTAWWAAKRPEAAIGMADRLGLAFTIGVAALSFRFASSAGPKSMPVLILFGGGALLAAIMDVRLIRRGELSGPRRIKRHLLRMCFALLIATFSFYPGQAKLFPQSVKSSGILVIPHLVLIGSMIYWPVRMRARKRAAAGGLALAGSR